MKAPNYLPQRTYRRLVADLVAASDADRVVELIGKYGNVWPENVRDDPLSPVPLDEAIYEILNRMTGALAFDKELRAYPELRDRVLDIAELPADLLMAAREHPDHMPLEWPSPPSSRMI